MNVSRNFVLTGIVFLLVGVIVGMIMGGSGDHTLAPMHAHINLVGFTLMMIFGLTYRVIPAMAESALAKWHYIIYAISAVVMVIMLYFILTEAAFPAVEMIMPIAELGVTIGVLLFAWNFLQNGK